VCAYIDVCACALYWEEKNDFNKNKKDSHCGKDKKNRKEKKSFYCMLDCLQVKVSDRVDGL
jgi:hypothetical protein